MTPELTTVQIIDELRDFAELKEDWNALLRSSPSNCPFLTWEWAHAWWTHLQGWSGLRIVAVRAGDELIGIAPLRISRGGLPWFSKLEFLGTGGAGSDYLDLIVRPGFESAAVQALLTLIESQGFALRMSHVPSSSLAGRLAQRLTNDGWTLRSTSAGVCPFIRLAGHSWESYLATRGPSHRANYRRRLKTVHRDFAMRFEQVISESGRADVLALLNGFHDRRFGRRGGSTAFQTAALRAFHDDITRRAHDAGWLRLYALYLDDRIAAAMYAFAYNGRFYFYQHGFDETYRHYSVGLLLMGLTIRAAIDEGAAEFDMLYGTETYKWLWADDHRPLGRLDVFPPHLLGRIHHRRVVAESSLRALARRILSRAAHAA